jgi:copper chaperone CopZ
MIHQLRAALLLICCVAVSSTSRAEDAPAGNATVKHQITGLFAPDREQDLQTVFEKLPDIKLIKIDFENAEATVQYDPEKAFPGAKPEQIVERLDNLVRGASNHTFGVKPLRTIDKEKLKRIEIEVAGLDCKACCLAAYEAIFRLKGVECATASFKEGRVTALINPEMIDKVELETALKQRGVEVKLP